MNQREKEETVILYSRRNKEGIECVKQELKQEAAGMVLDIFEIYQMFREKKIDIIYSGPIWSEGMEGLADTLRSRLRFDELPFSTEQAVFSVFVEQMNNMLMYSRDKEVIRIETEDQTDTREASRGMFILGVKDRQYFVESGNLIRQDAIEPLRKKLDYLNTLDKKELRRYYKEQMKQENTNPESRGAGLGMIEIARRANSPVEYDFRLLDNGLAFFSMYVTIG